MPTPRPEDTPNTAAAESPPCRATTIQPLPALLVNQIAAGEVIERPASVVKELVENAIDAGATRIRVTIEQGGRELIEVSDDGHGMSPADLPLALTAHATSKIATSQDLDSIATLGFRGEALASILSVSRLSLTSRTRNADAAARITGAGNEIEPLCPAGAPVGTTITVRNLFFNTPARRKFLRTDLTEYNHVNALLTRAALSQPTIGFAFINNNKVIFDLPAKQPPNERIFDLLGRELIPELLEINVNERGPQRTMSLWGLVGTPALARGSGKFQHTFLNGRPIRDRTILHAIKEAYRGLIDPNRFPLVVLYLDLDPAQVDVNVHPAKAEVRFRDPQAVHGLIYSTIRERLLNADITPNLNLNHPSNRKNSDDPHQSKIFRPSSALTNWEIQSPRTTTTSPADHRHTPAVNVDRSRLASFLRNRPARAGFSLQAARAALDTTAQSDSSPTPTPSPSPDSDSDSDSEAAPEAAPNSQVDLDRPARRVFQVHDSYLVMEDGDGIAIIDQHALHERVMFEALKSRILEGALESQHLLTPAVVNLTPAQLELRTNLEPLFKKLGIDTTPLGPQALGIHAFPSFLFDRNVDPVEFVTEIFDRAEADGLPPGDEEALHEVLDMMACKAAVKAGDRLSAVELRNLLELSEQIERAGRCPHGRPTTIRVSLEDLEKQFGRR